MYVYEIPQFSFSKDIAMFFNDWYERTNARHGSGLTVKKQKPFPLITKLVPKVWIDFNRACEVRIMWTIGWKRLLFDEKDKLPKFFYFEWKILISD